MKARIDPHRLAGRAAVSEDPPVSAAETRERFLIILADDHPPIVFLRVLPQFPAAVLCAAVVLAQAG